MGEMSRCTGETHEVHAMTEAHSTIDEDPVE